MRKAKTASILLFAVSLALFLFCIFVREGGQYSGSVVKTKI